jgi:hypothetical protein
MKREHIFWNFHTPIALFPLKKKQQQNWMVIEKWSAKHFSNKIEMSG